jgi:hypothetical protein
VLRMGLRLRKSHARRKKRTGEFEEFRRTGQDGMLIHHPPQLIIEETESLLEKWKHPDPYRAPTAPGGSKWERNLPVPSTERELSITRISRSHELDLLTCIPQRHHTCTCKLEQHSMGMSWRFFVGDPECTNLLA